MMEAQIPAGEHRLRPSLGGLPVRDEAGVNITVFSFVALLYDRHFANGPPQSGQEET